MLDQDFLDKLDSLSSSELRKWIFDHYNGLSYEPKAPFSTSGDTMDIIDRVLGLLNQKFSAGSHAILLERYEEALIYLFSQESNHPFSNPALIHRFILIFANCPPRGTRASLLCEILLPMIAKRKWFNFRVGARNMHFDMLELAIMLAKYDGGSFLGYDRLTQFLYENLELEGNARFSVIALNFYIDTYDIPKFFEVFEISFNILALEKMPSLVNCILLLYKQHPSLSISYFCSWLLTKKKAIIDSKDQMLNFERERLKAIFIDGRILKHLITSFERNFDGFSKHITNEMSNRVSLINFITASYFSAQLSPHLIKMQFENEHRDGFSELLYTKRRTLNDATAPEISRSLQGDVSNYGMFVLALVALVKLNDVEDIEIFGTQPAPLFSLDFQDLYLVIENDNHLLLSTIYSHEELLATGKKVLLLSVKETMKIWEILEQVNISSIYE